MAASIPGLGELGAGARRSARRLLAIGENRLELLGVELQEERERLVEAVLLGFCAVACGMLACATFTGTVLLLFWAYSPMGVLLGLTGVYAVAGWALLRRLAERLRDWHPFAETRGQLRKDRSGLEELLS